MRFLIAVILLLSFVGCSKEVIRPSAEAPVKPGEGAAREERRLSAEEQKQASLEIFKQILKISISTPDRARAAREVEPLYRKIIEEYPESPLAQESYLRLIELYLRDYRPPETKRAEETLQALKQRYPQSPIIPEAEKRIAGFYYNTGNWNGVIQVYREKIKEFIKTGKIDSAGTLFMYAEAMYHRGETEEAIKGYRWVVRLFPSSNEAYKARKMLEKLSPTPEEPSSGGYK